MDDLARTDGVEEPSLGAAHPRARGRRRERDVPLYQELAQRFAHAITSGVLLPGDRLPSVRSLRAQERVSTGTVMQAFARLEFLGLVESRPRSGYFVRPRRLLPAPASSRPRSTPQPVAVTPLVARVVSAIRDERLVPLGLAAPCPELVPLHALSRAMRAVSRPARGGCISYETPLGSERLRRAIARRALSWGVTVDPDEVLVTSGAAEAIFIALRAVAKPGDTVAIESPGYFGTLQALESLGLRALEIPCHPGSGMDLDALEATLQRERVAAVVAVLNFSNPTGSLMPEPSKRRLVSMLAARGIPLVEDDVYGDLAFDGSRPPCARAFDRDGLVLTCGSFSKTLAPGWRVGYVLPGRYRQEAQLHKFSLNVAAATAPQRALAHFLETEAYDRHLRRLRAALHLSSERIRDAVTAAFPPGTCVSRPAGGYVHWVELPRGVSGRELHERALAEGIAVVPGVLFGPRGGYERFIRISTGHRWEDRLARGVQTLGRIAGRMAAEARRAS